LSLLNIFELNLTGYLSGSEMSKLLVISKDANQFCRHGMNTPFETIFQFGPGIAISVTNINVIFILKYHFQLVGIGKLTKSLPWLGGLYVDT